LLSFANFFMRVRKVGFQGDNEKKYPEVGAIFKRLNQEAKEMTEQVKKLKEGEYKKLEAEAKSAKTPEASSRAGKQQRSKLKPASNPAPASRQDSFYHAGWGHRSSACFSVCVNQWPIFGRSGC
jgi:hypothetical protein